VISIGYMFLGSSGSSLSQLNTPHGLALDSSRSTLYISDTGNNRIISYPFGAVAGIVVAGANGQGSLNNQLNVPVGLYLDVSSNSFYIANSNAHNIVRWVVNASIWTLIAGNANGQVGFTSTMLYNPTDVTLDYMGNVYVTDNSNNRIQFFLSGQFNGTTIAGITSVSANAANTLNGPQSVTLDSNLNLYVVDTSNNRILKFERC
jgi:tripartite motif-containing protein 71